MDRLSVSSFSHIAFRVRSLEQSRAFYERLFGYDPFIETPLSHAALGQLTGGATSKAVLAMGLIGDKVLELVEYDGLPEEQVGFSHFALRVDDLDETYRRARELDARRPRRQGRGAQGPDPGRHLPADGRWHRPGDSGAEQGRSPVLAFRALRPEPR